MTLGSPREFIICQSTTCDNTFKKLNSEHRFCSKKCVLEEKNRPNATCEFIACKKAFKRSHDGQKFCSRACVISQRIMRWAPAVQKERASGKTNGDSARELRITRDAMVCRAIRLARYQESYPILVVALENPAMHTPYEPPPPKAKPVRQFVPSGPLYQKPKAVGITSTRKCLSCGKPFASAWVGNRMCNHCKGFKDAR